VTLKAVAALRKADVVAYFAKRGNRSNARRIMAPHMPPGMREIALDYPVTTEIPRTDEAYGREISAFYDDAAERLAVELRAGRTVAVLSEGDPLFYGSYMHVHVRLAPFFPASVIPGVTAMSGCWSEAGVPIAQGDDILSILPGTLAEERLAERLAGSDAAVIMKVGRNLAKIRRALASAGRLAGAIYVERGTMAESLAVALADKADDAAPYFSLVLVPGWEARR
jgi:precorrin-2/cobalt-factor-2 C20-methyltransferase